MVRFHGHTLSLLWVLSSAFGIFLHHFLLFLKPGEPFARCPRFVDSPLFHVTGCTRDYVSFPGSRHCRPLRDSGVKGTIWDPNNIGQLIAVGAWIKWGCIAEVGVCHFCIVSSPKTICRSLLAPRRFNTNVRCQIWFHHILSSTLLSYDMFRAASLCFPHGLSYRQSWLAVQCLGV